MKAPSFFMVSSLLCVGSQVAAPRGRWPYRQNLPSRLDFFPSGEIQLSYQLEKPAGRGPFPAIVVGHGSGETTKRACRFLVQRFLQRGYAVLCYDKRGVGQSTAAYVKCLGTRNSEEGFPILAADVAAGARFLRTRGDITGSASAWSATVRRGG